MSVFHEYARYYDLLYRDKDYQAETEYLHGLIQAGAPGARSVLNLGCGSGRHDRCLVERGYAVTGVDISEEMLRCARSAAEGSPDLAYHLGDVRSVRLEGAFDAVVSLFHVMSYQVENDDLASALATAFLHLKPGGLFVFDCWYGPGVLTDRPAVRVKELEDPAIAVTRIARPVMRPETNSVEVGYLVFVRDKATGAVQEIRETHHMRYLFNPELRSMLGAAGFESVDFKEWLGSSPPDFNSWNAVITARKPF